jgi:16S rRNA A1518/A1519 N6-dimethyltransferase RsmA/KsgA/DIM1 with predicted DNA glycosylase/AP lyase activity
MWLTEGFANVYCERLQMCHFCVTNVSLKHYITIKIKLTVSNLPYFITTHNAFVFVDSNSSISVTIQLHMFI